MSTTSVRREDEHLVIEDAMFRCEQEVCAYVDLEESSARVLLQPCDMDPESVVRCSCYGDYTVDIPAGARTIDVYVRGDLKSGATELELVGTVDLD